MKAKIQALRGVPLMIFLSVLFPIAGFYFFNPKPQPIKTVNLVKILRAEQFVAGKSLQAGRAPKDWMLNINQMSGSIRAVIKKVAGEKAVVVVSPAVVQGGVDITDAVLVALGLPTHIPGLLNPVLPGVTSTASLPTTEGESTWRTP